VEGLAAAAARWAPAELNAIDEPSLRAHVLAAVQPSADDSALARTPLLAPFITNAVLFRVREILVPVVAGGTLFTQLGYAVAALTGAPRPPGDGDAHHVGQKASNRVGDYDRRMQLLRKHGLTKAKAARMKEDGERLYVDETHGSTPPAPAVEVLLAGLAAPVSPAPPPVDAVPIPTQKKQKLFALSPGLEVISSDALECLRAQAADTSVRRHENETLVLQNAVKDAALARQQEETATETARAEAEAAGRRQEARAGKAAVVAAARLQVATEQKLGSKITSALKEAEGHKRAREVAEREKAAAAKALTEAGLARLKPEVEARVRAVLQAQLDRDARLKDAALARARAAEKRQSSAATLAKKRLERKREAEARVSGLEVEKDELAEELGALQAEHAKLVARQGPDLGGGRKRGRFDAGPWQMRALIWGQLARRTPPTAVGPNVVDAIRLLAPGAPVREPHAEQVRKMRVEMGLAGQALAASQFASSKRVLCGGFDETTKLQTGLLSTNFQCEMEDGAVRNLVLQGVVIIPGGTAAQVADAMAARVLGRARASLQGWKDVHEQQNGARSWAGPNPEDIGLHRLGGALIMSDTCNGARAAKRLMMQRIAAAVAEDIGPAEWKELSEEQQQKVARAYSGDCMQHLRNIFLDAMSAAASAHLKVALEDSLSEFAFHERMTPDGSALIRAMCALALLTLTPTLTPTLTLTLTLPLTPTLNLTLTLTLTLTPTSYKEFHHEGDYAKGKGKEMAAWLLENFPTDYYLPLERAGGSRQDLSFDGAVPIYANRLIMSKFLHKLVFVPNHSNILEDYLWHTLGSIEIVALLRVHALFDLLVSRPLRWLSGKSAELRDWSIYSMAGVLDLVEQARPALNA